MRFLKNHPFAVAAHFDRSLVLTFAIKKDELHPLIPECLQLDTFQDEWAFVAVAMVQTRFLRPKGLPKFMGSDFFLIGYRVFVRYKNQQGRKLRGLYILKSETDSKKMEVFGNIFTHYQYTTTDVNIKADAISESISSENSQFEIIINHSTQSTNLPSGSPFSTWKVARRYAGPLPFTFTFQSDHNSVLIIEGVRNNWNPEPVHIENYHFDFLDKFKFSEMLLANAFQIQNVPYYWKKGRLESWGH